MGNGVWKKMTAIITTATGFQFDLQDPKESYISVLDIALALSNICRFTGQIHEHYSVAEHSVLISHMVDSKIALKALLHDAAEAYVGDTSSPLKSLVPAFKDIESNIQSVINNKLTGPVSEDEAKEIKAFDMVLGSREVDYFYRGGPSFVPNGKSTLSANDSYTLFLERYIQLKDYD